MRYSEETLKKLIDRYGIFEKVPLSNGKEEEHWVVRVPLSLPEGSTAPYDLLMVVWKNKKNAFSYYANVISHRYNLILHSEVLERVKALTGTKPQVYLARNLLYATLQSLKDKLLVVENSYSRNRAIRIHLYGKEERNGKPVVFPIFHNLIRRTHHEWEERSLPLPEELREAIEKISIRIEPVLEKKVSLRRLYRLLGDVRTVYRIKKGDRTETKDYPIGKALVEAVRREYGALPTLKDVLVEISMRIAKKETGLTYLIRRKIRNRLALLIEEVESLTNRGVRPLVL